MLTLISGCATIAATDLTVGAICDAWETTIPSTELGDRRVLRLQELLARETQAGVCN